jgi:repressor LexA
MSSAVRLSKQQEAIRSFIAAELAAARPCPTHREIAAKFGFHSSFAAACHVQALVRKGILIAQPGKARALRLAEHLKSLHRSALAEIPLFGTIPAGFGEDRQQETTDCVVVDVATLGFQPTRFTFALRVTGDSMVGRHICHNDIVILEHATEPRHGQIVAALIDGKSTLKTFVLKGSKPFLKAENPKYPNLIPCEELVIQGVFRMLIRKG